METKTIRQREFIKGSNEAGTFWEHQTQDGTRYVAQKGKGCWWWVLYQLKDDQVNTLNCCLTDHDGKRQEDPLYQWEQQSAPIGIDDWLERLAGYISQQHQASDRQRGRKTRRAAS